MRIIVSGGAGFLGSHLCETLLNKGHKVVCIDNLVTGSLEKMESFKDDSNFTFYNADIIDPIKSEIKKLKFDAIFHLACPASPPQYLQIPIKTLLANSHGTHNLLKLAKRDGAKFLLASTSEIYGDPAEVPQTEQYWGNVNPIGIRSCYDEGKRYSEAMVMAYIREYDLDARIIRIFNSYGPRIGEKDGRAVPNFITQALRGEDLTVFGDGSQTRSFCYVSDTIDGIIKAMFKKKTQGEVMNIGNPDERTILELARIVKDLIRNGSEIVHEPLPQDDPVRRKPDITKAERILRWGPKVKLKEGLEKTINYFRKREKRRS